MNKKILQGAGIALAGLLALVIWLGVFGGGGTTFGASRWSPGGGSIFAPGLWTLDTSLAPTTTVLEPTNPDWVLQFATGTLSLTGYVGGVLFLDSSKNATNTSLIVADGVSGTVTTTQFAVTGTATSTFAGPVSSTRIMVGGETNQGIWFYGSANKINRNGEYFDLYSSSGIEAQFGPVNYSNSNLSGYVDDSFDLGQSTTTFRFRNAYISRAVVAGSYVSSTNFIASGAGGTTGFTTNGGAASGYWSCTTSCFVGASTAHSLVLFTGNSSRWTVDSSGNFAPSLTDGTLNIGSVTGRAGIVFAVSVSSTNVTSTRFDLGSTTGNIKAGGANARKTIVLSAAGGWGATTTNSVQGPTAVSLSNGQVLQLQSFSATTTQYEQWTFPMPDGYDGQPLDWKVYWTSTSTNSGGVIWGVQCRSYADGAALDQAWGTAATTSDTNAGSLVLSSVTSTAQLTFGGTPIAGEEVQCRAYRDAENFQGTAMSSTVNLISVKLEFGAKSFSD